jgi:ATP-dependent RNA helicase DDX21
MLPLGTCSLVQGSSRSCSVTNHFLLHSGIDIQDVDLVVQLDPPRDADTYVHRSGRTGRAGNKGISVLLFNRNQSRDIVRIERELGHGFKFDLVGPPSTEAALRAAAKTSAIASKGVPDETAALFKESAAALLSEDGADPEDVVARCLAAISRRSAEVQTRSLLTGELGYATVEMSNSEGRAIAPNDVMFTVSKLSRMSQKEGDVSFDSDIGKIQPNRETGTAVFDMGVDDAKKLVKFSADTDSGGAVFALLKEMEIERDNNFGKSFERRGGGGQGRGGRGGGGWGGNDRRQGGGYSNDRRSGGGGGRGGGGQGPRSGRNNYHGGGNRANQEGRPEGRSYEGRPPSRGGEGRSYENRGSPRGGGERSGGGGYDRPRGGSGGGGERRGSW